MKISLLSDLHLSMHPIDAPRTDADVVVIAGDLGRPALAIAWAAQFDVPTLFVAGNHEFYGSDLVSAMAQLRELAREPPPAFRRLADPFAALRKPPSGTG
jgi:predicted phosphodiesterase